MYHTVDLLDHDWRDRANKIVSISAESGLIPRTEIFEHGRHLVYKQDVVRRTTSTPCYDGRRALLSRLAVQLDSIAHVGLVHGDLVRKNIILTDQGYQIVDWEPSLKQAFNHREVLMYTPPFIALCDYLNKNLTCCSDMVAFFCFCVETLNSNMRIRRKTAIDALCSGRSIVESLFDVDERGLFIIDYKGIYRYAHDIASRSAT